ncbi:thiolase family protein [Sphingomonas crocodyli]|uniref:Thiolase family protein n=1 Tax=Sphingomonas crocodyli TaxID=1979270 RepID=A0A437M695_9SPHN|nr:thiolase family protein [Sphingomonas crocodyli]RVT93169.1 thiolase family protein [Sphingomonas crocodyli]
MPVETHAEKRVVISGAGQSEVGRPSTKTALQLTIDACSQAIREAGLKPSDIDGLTTYPGPMPEPKGFSPVGPTELMFSMGLNPSWVAASTDGHAHMGAIFSAIQAITSGMCKHVLIFRTVSQATVQVQAKTSAAQSNLMGRGSTRISGGMAWNVPFNAVSATPMYALYAQAYFSKYGATSEQLGAIAVNARGMAALNPNATLRKPLTIEDYMASRFIATPLRLFDCDIPVDGSTALVLSHVDTIADLAQPPIRIESIGMSIGGFGIGLHQGDFTTMASNKAGDMLWSRTDLKPADVDVAQIYDGFSILTLMWMESLRLCGRGEAAAFVEGGTRIGLGGELPLNTSGGQLSQGRLHGYGHTYEACVQLWGRAGDRQVKDARVCAVANGGFGYGALLLRRD